MPDTKMPDTETIDRRDPFGAEEQAHDLNPNMHAGENHGDRGPHAEQNAPSASDLKEVRNHFNGWQEDDLKQITILPTGSRLEQGAVYVDLHAPERGEFKAMGNETAHEGTHYVPKNVTPYPLWNRLIGVTNPERLDQADDA
jgi:hypothetical protein